MSLVTPNMNTAGREDLQMQIRLYAVFFITVFAESAILKIFNPHIANMMNSAFGIAMLLAAIATISTAPYVMKRKWNWIVGEAAIVGIVTGFIVLLFQS